MLIPRTGRCRRVRQRRGRAFTLFELVIVMSIMAVVAAIAIPRYGNSIARYRVESAARRIAGDIARTAVLARATSSAQSIDFRPASNAYAIAAERSLVNNTMGSVVAMGEEPYHATLVSADFGGVKTLTFNGFGVSGTSGTVVVRVGSMQRTVAFDANSGEAAVGP